MLSSELRNSSSQYVFYLNTEHSQLRTRRRGLVGARGFGLRPRQLAVGHRKYGDLFLLAVGARRLQILSTLNWYCCTVVGARGFEPPTSCSQSRRATGLRYAPTLEFQPRTHCSAAGEPASVNTVFAKYACNLAAATCKSSGWIVLYRLCMCSLFMANNLHCGHRIYPCSPQICARCVSEVMNPSFQPSDGPQQRPCAFSSVFLYTGRPTWCPGGVLP